MKKMEGPSDGFVVHDPDPYFVRSVTEHEFPGLQVWPSIVSTIKPILVPTQKRPPWGTGLNPHVGCRPNPPTLRAGADEQPVHRAAIRAEVEIAVLDVQTADRRLLLLTSFLTDFRSRRQLLAALGFPLG